MLDRAETDRHTREISPVGAPAALPACGGTVLTPAPIPSSGDPADPLPPPESAAEGLHPTSLRCEYLVDPLGIDTPAPRFSWQLSAAPAAANARGRSQSAYRILVAAAVDELAAGRGTVWDSGRAVAAGSTNVAYAGRALASSERCYWQVRVWDEAGMPGPWSAPAWFEMGLLNASDWTASWICAPDPAISSPLLRKEFAVTGPVTRARAYVAGLGFSELYLNGAKVGDRVLDPAPTFYHNDQEPELQDRVLYTTYDVTDLLRDGRNAVGVWLGNGWYSSDRPPELRADPLSEPYGQAPRAIVQLVIETAGGNRRTVASDTTWRASASPILANDLCDGEFYDARREQPGWSGAAFDDAHWQPAVPAPEPVGPLQAQAIPPITVSETLPAADVTSPRYPYGAVYVVDFGQHFSGWVRLRLRGPRGSKVSLRHGGRRYADGFVDQRNNRDARQTDTYVLSGDGEETWEPRFTLHGFRYVELHGLPAAPRREQLEGRVVHSAVPPAGTFHCSNELLNQIHRNVQWTFRSSFQGALQDAGERSERVSWLGDPGFVAEDYLYTFDVASLWSKWLDDIRGSQRAAGDLPVISPIHWRKASWRPWPAWMSTYPLFVWLLYRHYDDRQVLERHYDAMRRLVDYLGTMAREHVIEEGLGDHMEPQDDGISSWRPLRTPVALTSTAYYFRDAQIVAGAAAVLGRAAEAARYRALAAAIEDAFNRRFLDPASGRYAGGSQTSQALPLALGLVPAAHEAAAVANLIAEIVTRHDGHLATGIIGAGALQQVLPEHGHGEVMYRIATQTTYPSWGHTIANGATTVWESFEGGILSLNMKMFCSVAVFLYRYLAGIALAGRGYRQVVIKPRLLGDLTSAAATVATVNGAVSSRWTRRAGTLQLQVTVPVNCSARVAVPVAGTAQPVIREDDRVVWRDDSFCPGAAGIGAASADHDYVTFEVGSGEYRFQVAAQELRT